jgi:hypothetical protein
MFCNNYLNDQRKKVKKDEPFFIESTKIKGNEDSKHVTFNYKTVPEAPKPKILEERYIEELNKGTNFYPKYDNDILDQKVIYDYELYSKPLYTDRVVEPVDNNGLPRSIAQIFEESITDFKKLTPLKHGVEGDFIVQGASSLAVFNPDYITYDDEKPENGGIYSHADKYKGNLNLQGYDPLTQMDSAVF